MRIITRISEMKVKVQDLKSEGKCIGFVPTMGYIHEGHLSLVRESTRRANCTVVSIFVNPAQFGPKEDFNEYPRDLKRDSEILGKEGVDYLFMPEKDQMYPEGYRTYVEVLDLKDKLCGLSRPGHFRGVCTVVLKLLNIVDPDVAFFGQKDAQQAFILKKMVCDLDLDVKIEVLPTVREEDGLALSSRNTLLEPAQRTEALLLSRSLRKAQELIDNGERNTATIIRRMRDVISSVPSARIDYVEIVDCKNLNPLAKIENEALIALAVFIGKVRLIDNIIVCIKE